MFIPLSYVVLWHKLNIELDILSRTEQQMEHFENKYLIKDIDIPCTLTDLVFLYYQYVEPYVNIQ